MKNLFTLLLSCLVLTSCLKHHSQKNDWQTFAIDKNISKKNIFKQLAYEKEIKMMIDFEEPKKNKTTKIIYNNSDEFVCEPRFWNDLDTLSISIVYHTGYGSKGFNIKTYKNKYGIYPFYSSDDLSLKKKVSSTFKNSIQKLILNQSEFKPNDSIYGYIEFEKKEYTKHGDSITHKGVGYFRGKIVYQE